MAVEDLERLVGTWVTQAVAPWAEGAPPGETVFEWLEGGPLLLQRVHIPIPEAPDLIAVIAPDPDSGGFLQHYFDSRGVVRLYRMTLGGGVWTLSRTTPDFSPLDFSQRYTGVFGDDGNSIAGRWEIAHEPGAWQPDFELNYERIA